MIRHRSAAALLGTLALTAGLVLGVAPSASARIVERGQIDDAFSETIDDFCDVEGLSVDLEGTVTGRYHFNDRGNGYYLENLQVIREFTDADTGFTALDIQPNTLSKDLSVVDNGDGTLTIITLATGGGRLYGHEGKLIAKGSGQVRFEIVYDYVNDVEVSNELIFGSTGTNDDYCEAILEDWGYL
jgi:hypothetical protein